MHSGQLRQSGEAYITHPLNVAYIASIMSADIDTICAALLHDTLEDSLVGLRIGLNRFIEKYNTYRPHSSLKGLTPLLYIKSILGDFHSVSYVMN